MSSTENGELIEKVRRLYVENNMTLVEVGEAVGISKKSVLRLMQANEIPRRSCRKRDQSGAANPRWKGQDAGYNALHARVEQARGKPSRCEQCGLADPEQRYEWANLTGKYDDVEDFERMCVPCHRRYDNHRRNPNPRRPGRRRAIINCSGCQQTRQHTGRGMCGTCYSRSRRATAKAVAS